jgi:hypothetical protein
MSRLFNRKALGAIGAVFVLVVAGGAYAYWTNGGSGAGSATTGTNVAISVVQTSTPTGLSPGGTAAALSGNFNNTNSSAVFVNEINATIGTVTRTAEAIAAALPCTAADYLLGGFPVQIDAQVASGSAVGSWTGGTIQLVNSGTNQDGCKDATVALTYTSN